MLRIYTADIAALEFSAALPLLSPYRRERLERTRGSLAKKQGAGAELLLHIALRELGISALPEIEADENGKPRFLKGGLFFSLSHSGSRALCAVSDRELGADLQEKKSGGERLVRRFFAPDEQAYIFSAPDRDEAFTKIWAKKESYAKALGLGLKLPMESFSVFALPEPWRLWSRETDGFCAAVCTTGDEKPAFLRKIDPSRLIIG